MPAVIAALASRFGATHAGGQRDAVSVALVVSVHVAALAIMFLTEDGPAAKLAFLLTWGILNFLWLGLMRRPAAAATLSLLMIVLLILVSRLKYDIIWMTANFLDFLVIDTGTVGFLLSVMPGLYRDSLIVLAVVLPVVALIWRFDPFRARLRTALVGFATLSRRAHGGRGRTAAGGMEGVPRRQLRL